MEHEYQSVINILIMLAGGLGGYILKSTTDAVKDLQKADVVLTDKIHGIETLVIGDYVHRDNMEAVAKVLFEKLDKIDAKLDRKTDKEFCQNYHKVSGQCS